MTGHVGPKYPIGQGLAEEVGQLRFGPAVDLVVEVFADAPDGARIGVDGLRLQAFEFQVLQM